MVLPATGHDDVLTGLALVLVAVTLAQAIRGYARPPHAGPLPPARAGKLQLS